ncbi:hypothetical protein ACN28S_11550 [Cystobacter fuscus]
MSFSVKNNSNNLLLQLLQNSSTQGSQGQGKLNLETAGKMLQMLGQMMTALQTLQDSIQGKPGDSFGAGGKPGARAAPVARTVPVERVARKAPIR